MPDIAAISGLLTSLRASAELTKLLLEVRDAEKVRTTVYELQSAILSAQTSAISANSAQTELTERVRDLEKQIVEFENWKTEAERYQLHEIRAGTFVYALKPGMENGEPPHHLCSNCYQQRRKSILQGFRKVHGMTTTDILKCQACSSEIIVASKPIEWPAAPRRRSDWIA